MAGRLAPGRGAAGRRGDRDREVLGGRRRPPRHLCRPASPRRHRPRPRLPGPPFLPLGEADRADARLGDAPAHPPGDDGRIGVFWRGVPAVRPERPSVSVIRPNLLVGEYPNPEDVAWLRDAHGVTTVLSLQDDADLASKNLQLRDLELAYRREGLAFHRVPVPDGATEVLADRLPVIVTLLAELVARGERVYLHCNAGMNRAPTVAIAYLHTHEGLPLAVACEDVKAKRHCVPYMRVLQAQHGPRG
ncbi:MAG: hypothetical protein E6J71_25230 [Deltaproteobacteria bacterium]|nr:MAG: hypothetical protein E6J77_13570 [Deltaproteobacteria bacterium]TMB11583.1 MAG: hypothetical protein E6J71_25230 [Deltaproteobacteria bacterium]